MARQRGCLREEQPESNKREESDDGPRSRSRNLLHEIPVAERPRERLLRFGAQSLSDAELLAVVLGRGHQGRSVIDLARELLTESGGLGSLLELEADLMRVRGVGRLKTATLLAMREIACRVSRREIAKRRLLDKPSLVANYLLLRYGVSDQEVAGALYLDVRNRLIAERDIFRGSLNQASVEPRQVLKEALTLSAFGFVFFHTHPSGDPTPSREDVAFTKRLAAAGEVVGVRLLDHLIVGANKRWVSLRRMEAW